jgi:hypothetical protein
VLEYVFLVVFRLLVLSKLDSYDLYAPTRLAKKIKRRRSDAALRLILMAKFLFCFVLLLFKFF